MPGTIIIKPLQAKLEKNIKLDLYCTAVVGDHHVEGSICKNGGSYPIWDDSLKIRYTDEPYCYLEIKDRSPEKDKTLGICAIDLSELMKEGSLQKWYGLYCDRKPAGEILINAAFVLSDPLKKDADYNNIRPLLKELGEPRTRNIDVHMQAHSGKQAHATGGKPGFTGNHGQVGNENRDPNRGHIYRRETLDSHPGDPLGNIIKQGNNITAREGQVTGFNPLEKKRERIFEVNEEKPAFYLPQSGSDLVSKDILCEKEVMSDFGATPKQEENQYNNTQTLPENITNLAGTRSDIKDSPMDDQKEISKVNETQNTLVDIVNALDSKEANGNTMTPKESSIETKNPEKFLNEVSRPVTLEDRLKDYHPSQKKPKCMIKTVLPKESESENIMLKENIDEQKRLEEILTRSRGIDERQASREDEECNILFQSTQLVPNEIAAKEGIHHLPVSTTVQASHRRFSEDYSNRGPQPAAKPATSIITIKVSDIKSKFLDNVKKGSLLLKENFNNLLDKKGPLAKDSLFNSHAPYLENYGRSSKNLHNSPPRLRATEMKQKFFVEIGQLKEISKGTLERLQEKMVEKGHHRDAEGGTNTHHSKPSTLDTLDHGRGTFESADTAKNGPTHRLAYSGIKNVVEMPIQVQQHFQAQTAASGAHSKGTEDIGHVKQAPVKSLAELPVPEVKEEKEGFYLTPSKVDFMKEKANEAVSQTKQASAEKLIHFKRVGAEEWTQGNSRNDKAFIDEGPSSQSDLSRKEITEETDYFGVPRERLSEQKDDVQQKIDTRSPISKTDTLKQKLFEGVLQDRSTKSEQKKLHDINSARNDHFGSSSKTNNVLKKKFKEEIESMKVAKSKGSEGKVTSVNTLLKPAHEGKSGIQNKTEGLKPKTAKGVEQVKGTTHEKMARFGNIVEKKEAKHKAHYEPKQSLSDTKKNKGLIFKHRPQEGVDNLKHKAKAADKGPNSEHNHFIPIASILNNREKYAGGVQWSKNSTGAEDLPLQSKKLDELETKLDSNIVEDEHNQIKLPIENPYQLQPEARKRSLSFENQKQDGLLFNNFKFTNKLGKTHHGPIDLKQHENVSHGHVKRRTLSIDMPTAFVNQVKGEAEPINNDMAMIDRAENQHRAKESHGAEHNSGRKPSSENQQALKKERAKGRLGNLPPLESKITQLMQEFFSELNKNNLCALDHNNHEEIVGKERVSAQRAMENDENYNPNRHVASGVHSKKVGNENRGLKW